jgi:hypothetical protein
MEETLQKFTFEDQKLSVEHGLELLPDFVVVPLASDIRPGFAPGSVSVKY